MVDLFYIEDDLNIASAVQEYLEQKDFKVNIYTTLALARQALKNHVPALVYWTGICRTDVGTAYASGFAATGRNCRLFSLLFGEILRILFRVFKMVQMIMWSNLLNWKYCIHELLHYYAEPAMRSGSIYSVIKL